MNLCRVVGVEGLSINPGFIRVRCCGWLGSRVRIG